jgi:hypothetical protein
MLQPGRKKVTEVFRRIYGPKYKDGEWKIRTNRELEELNKGKIYSTIDKGSKNKLTGSAGENGRRTGCPKRFSLKNWRGRDEEEDPGKDEEKKCKEIFKCWE